MIETASDPANELPSQLDSTPPVETNVVKAKKTWNFFLPLFGLLVVLIASYLVYFFKIKSENNLTTIPSSSPAASQEPVIVAQESTNWSTYTNQKAGYSINYPSSWVWKESSDGLGTVFKPNDQLADENSNSFIRVSVMKKTLSQDTKQTFDDYVKTAGPQEIQNFQSLSSIEKMTTAAGTSGYTVTWNVAPLMGGKASSSLPFTYFEKPDDQTVTIQVVLESEKYLDIYNQMIKTFKLTDRKTVSSDPNLKSYHSSNLSVTFSYQAKTGNQEIFVSEEKNKICVSYQKNDLGCKIGQFVEIFEKNVDESLASAIKRIFLPGKDPARCLVEITDSKEYPETFVKAEITYPRTGDYGMQEMQEDSSYCSPEYSQTNGIRYFLEDQIYKEKFAFFSIGQYGIPAGEQKNWQDTFNFE